MKLSVVECMRCQMPAFLEQNLFYMSDLIPTFHTPTSIWEVAAFTAPISSYEIINSEHFFLIEKSE